MHYESKNHDKKINSWLLEWSKKTGEPVPKRQRAIKEGPVGPNAVSCKNCLLFGFKTSNFFKKNPSYVVKYVIFF